MKIVFIVLAAILVLAAAVLPIVLLFVWPDTWLPGVRDTAIIYASMFQCVGAILFIVMTGLLTLIFFTIRDKIVPALEKVDDTAKTIRGTATFVSESVVAPVIKVAGAAAGTRAMVQTLMRRNPPKPKEQKGEGSKQ